MVCFNARFNSSVEYSEFRGVSDVKKHLTAEIQGVVLLDTCAISEARLEEVYQPLSLLLESTGYVDLAMIAEDIELRSSNIPLLAKNLARFVDQKKHNVLLERFIISEIFVDESISNCDSFVESLVASSVGKSKKKRSAISSHEISIHLRSVNSEIASELFDSISQIILPTIRESFERVLHEYIPKASIHAVNDRERILKQLFASFAEEFAKLDLFLEGISKIDGILQLFYYSDEKAKASLLDHLSSTIGNQVYRLSRTIHYLSSHEEAVINLSCSQAVEMYSQIELSAESCTMFDNLLKIIDKGEIDLVMSVLPSICGASLEKVLGLVDKPRVMNEYRGSLFTQLERATDDASVLHISVLLLFIREHGACLYASGKFVPSMIKHGFVGNEEIRKLLGTALRHVKTVLVKGVVDGKEDVMSQVRTEVMSE